MNNTNPNPSPYAHLELVVSRESSDPSPLISVVVCSYCHAAFIRQCLESINPAPDISIEVIVIDDGSRDDTLQICRSYDFRPGTAFRVFQKSNRGLVDSLRAGLAMARGRFVMFIASDDYYDPQGLCQVAGLLSKPDTDIDVLICQSTYTGGAQDGTDVYGKQTVDFFSATPAKRAEIMCTEYPAPMLLQSTVFRVDFLRRNHCWDAGLRLDDWPTFIRVFLAEHQQGARVRFMPGLRLSFYRVHTAGLHNDRAKMLRLTEEVALNFVPSAYRARCLANVRIDRALVDLYEGRWAAGLLLFAKGLLTYPSWSVASRVVARARRKFSRLFTRLLSRSHA